MLRFDTRQKLDYLLDFQLDSKNFFANSVRVADGVCSWFESDTVHLNEYNSFELLNAEELL